jgi:hypothetical protein
VSHAILERDKVSGNTDKEIRKESSEEVRFKLRSDHKDCCSVWIRGNHMCKGPETGKN